MTTTTGRAVDEAHEELAQRREGPPPQLLRVRDLEHGAPGARHRRHLAQHGEDAREGDDVVGQERLHGGAVEAPQVLAQGIDDAVEGLVGHGLALVAAAVEDHGGRLCARSSARKRRTSAVLPMPDPPWTVTVIANPDFTVAYASRRRASSVSLPTKGGAGTAAAGGAGSAGATSVGAAPMRRRRRRNSAPEALCPGARRSRLRQSSSRSGGTSATSEEGAGGSSSCLRRSTSSTGPVKGREPGEGLVEHRRPRCTSRWLR